MEIDFEEENVKVFVEEDIEEDKNDNSGTILNSKKED